MRLTLDPQLGLPGQPEMTLHIEGDVITIDGVPYDLGGVPEGGEGWPEGDSPFLAPIIRQGGLLHVAIVARLGCMATPEQGGPWGIENASGDVSIPAARIEEVAE